MRAPRDRRRTRGGLPRRQPDHHRSLVDGRWEDRPLLAALLRLAVVAAPVAASLGAAFVTARVMGAPEGVGESTLWWFGVLGASLAALVAFDRAARRLLPLAALLELSLLFPDRAPSRLGVALRSGSTRRLREREVEALRRGDQEPAVAARTILVLAASLGVHDRDTRGHSERVRAYADLIAAELGLDAADRDRLRWAALLHDLGKLTVPAHTLNSTETLSEEDWDALRRHPVEGARLAAPLREWLGRWAEAIEQHHERYDGSGYPYGLAGEQLSLAARIVAVADSYDAMTSPRSYTTPRSAPVARQELAAKAGIDFDPGVVRAFLSVSLGRLRWVMGPLAFLAALPLGLPAAGVRRGLESAGRTATLGTMSLAATMSIVEPPAVAPELGPPQAPLARAPVDRPAAGDPTVPVPVPTAATEAAGGEDEPAAPGVERAVAPGAPAPAGTSTTRPPQRGDPPPALDRSSGVTATTAPPAAAGTAPTSGTAASGTAASGTAAPTSGTAASGTAAEGGTAASTPAPAATSTPTTATPSTTTAAPATTTTCRTVPEDSARPCQPPRWGHTESGNPVATP